MKLHSACVLLQAKPPPARFSPPQLHSVTKHHGNHISSKKQMLRFQVQHKSLRIGVANVNSSRKLAFRVNAGKWSDSEQCRGKPGSVSFNDLTYQSLEESKLVSSPSEKETDYLHWFLAPIALISGLVIPQLFIVGVIEKFFKNVVLVEILSSLSSEVMFYAGLAVFLLITEHVQQQYLEFSSKSWSRITGLKGYITSVKITTRLKIGVPLVAVYVTRNLLDLLVLVSLAPYFVSFIVQREVDKRLALKGSICWPLSPIIFEVYRIYQLTRATAVMERLINGMGMAAINPAALEIAQAVSAVRVIFRLSGLVCIWSLLMFLLPLFPSRLVRENY